MEKKKEKKKTGCCGDFLSRGAEVQMLVVTLLGVVIRGVFGQVHMLGKLCALLIAVPASSLPKINRLIVLT